MALLKDEGGVISRFIDGTTVEVSPKGFTMRGADGQVKVTMGTTDNPDLMVNIEPPERKTASMMISTPMTTDRKIIDAWWKKDEDPFTTKSLEAMDAKMAELKKRAEEDAYRSAIEAVKSTPKWKTLELNEPALFKGPGKESPDDELADLMKESMKVTAESLREDVKRLIFNLAKAQTQGITESSIHELIEEIMTEEKKTEEQIALEAVAQKLTDHWVSEEWVLSSEKFMLNAPMNLTILRPEKGYGKQAHIGGEEFEPQRAYVGKKGAIIIVFKPNSMEAYDHMEMTFSDAVQHLTGFQAHLMEVGVFADLAAIKDKKEAVLAAARQKEFGERYGDFGSW